MRGPGVRFLLCVLTGIAVVAAAADAAPRSVPKSVQGLWAYEPGDCGRQDSDGLLTIGSRTVLFFASSYDVKRVVRMKDGTLKISGFVSGEGEADRERGGLSLKLLARDRLEVSTGSVHVYHRCERPAGTAR